MQWTTLLGKDAHLTGTHPMALTFNRPDPTEFSFIGAMNWYGELQLTYQSLYTWKLFVITMKN